MDSRNQTGGYSALKHAAAVLNLSARSRVCLTGQDRVQFLHGQVTNDIKKLKPGEGCYAALVTAKGKMESDMNVYCLPDELLLDFEPGLLDRVKTRLEKYIIADDVAVVDVSDVYGLFSVQGPKSVEVLSKVFGNSLPEAPYSSRILENICLANHPRFGSAGFDVFLPQRDSAPVWEQLLSAALEAGGAEADEASAELARIEAGIPRYGVDMDESNLAPETGIAARAISYSKGCYIGQEVIARIRTYGQVAKSLRRLSFAAGIPRIPRKSDKLLYDGKEAGFVTSAAQAPGAAGFCGLGYLRKEVPDGAAVTALVDAVSCPVAQQRLDS